MIAGIDPNPDNFVSAGVINTKSMLVGCLLRLEPNIQTQVRRTEEGYMSESQREETKDVVLVNLFTLQLQTNVKMMQG